MTEMWIIRIISFLMVWFFFSYLKKCYQLSKAKERLVVLEDSYETMSMRYLYYKGVLHQLTVSSNWKCGYPESIKEAVRYAMQKSHPDNGGRKEDFIKFRELYKTMKQEDKDG